MMMRISLTLFLATAALTAFAIGPTESSSSRHSKAYGSDEKWWKCNALDASKGCDTGPLTALGLSKQEEAFVREKLDRIAWRPQKFDKEVASKLLNAKPSTDIAGKQIYYAVGPGVDDNRAVSLYYDSGAVFMIHWYQPGRFVLVRASSF